MSYKASIKEEIRFLRKKGYSLGQIHEKTHVPKTTIRSWIKDILLSAAQVSTLSQRTQYALQKGRARAQLQKRKTRLQKEQYLIQKASEQIGQLTKREVLLAGIALYWGEGFKNAHERRLGFCNSDPEMILFYLAFLRESLGIAKKDIVARVSINASYAARTKEIEEYWSKITKIPSAQFTQTFYQYSQWKKQYKTDDYHGVLRIHVQNSLDNLLRMKGWILGLKHAKIVDTRQDSSAG